MKFSICIPNYNYGEYIGETIDSVLSQDFEDFEIVITDNKSTDNSWEVIQSYLKKDSRVRAYQNATNLGFAGNLDEVSSKALGEFLILLSSDDTMNPMALTVFSKTIEALGNSNCLILGSSWNRIDSDSKLIQREPIRGVWREDDFNSELTELIGDKVYSSRSADILKRCFSSYKGAFNFAATCYSREAYQKVGGYSGSRLINPDKWFHWKLLGEVENAIYIDETYFNYRWHSTNQTAIQNKTGVLKQLVDEYRSTFEVPDSSLTKASFSREQLVNSFISKVILPYAFSKLKDGNILEAKRALRFGRATYPKNMKVNNKSQLMRVLVSLGALGIVVSKLINRTWQRDTMKK